MSKTIDERVVEMRFDNDDFESNAKESLGTLERLKQALSFKTSTDEIDNLARSVGNVDMSGLGGAVEAVKNKFSALEVIAVTALMNITNKAINAGEALVKSLTLDQVSAGWDKYADKTTAVQTIMSATASQFTDTAEQMAYVNEQLDKLNAFTDETSYNFVDMVGNIGKFTANNIPLDKAVTSMQGIATWAAISGQNASTASRAMYQLSQAMGGGVIRLQDWMSIEQANMATAEFKETALETAVSLGTLTKSADGTYKTLEGNEVTIENFRSTLQDLWFTSDVLTTSLDKYGKFSNIVLDIADQSGLTVTDLIGMTTDLKEGTLDMDHWMDETGKTASELQGYLDILGDEELDLGFRAMRAAQEAKTFQEAIDATKDAVSTGWMNTFEIIFGDYEQAKTLWTGLANELYDVFAASGEERNELLEDVFSEKKGGWDKLAESVENVGGSVEDFQNILIDTAKQHGIEIDKMIEDAGSFENSLKNGWLNGDLIKEGLFTFREGLTDIDDATSLAADQLDNLGEIAKKVINGDFGEGDEVMERLVETGYDYDQVMRAVNKITNEQELSFTDLTQAQLENLGITADQAIAMEEYRELCGTSKDALSELTDEMVNGPKKSGRTLLFESIANVWESIKTILGEVKAAWQEVFPPTTAERIYNSLEAVNEFSAGLKAFAEKIAPAVGRAFKSVFLVIDTFLSAGKQVASFIGSVLTSAMSKLNFKMGDFTVSILDVVQRFHDWVDEAQPVRKALETISGGIEKVIDWIMNMVEKFTSIPEVQEAIQKIQEVFGYLFQKVTEGGPGFLDILHEIQSFIANNFPNLTGIIQRFIDSFKGMDKLSFSGILESIGMLRDDLFTLLTEGIGKGNTFQKTWGKIKTAAKDALDTFNQYIPKFNSGTILSVGLASSLIATILKFGDLAKAIKSPVTLINNLFSSMTGAFKNLGAVLKGVALIPLAVGIGMIANAIAKLAELPAGNIIAAGAAIGVVTAAIAGLVYAIGGGKGGKGGLKSFKQIGLTIAEIAVAMVAIGAALYAVSQMQLEDILPKLGIFAVVIGGMLGITYALSKIAPKLDASISAALSMVAFAASVWILVQALKDLANDVVGFKTLEAATTSLFDIIMGFGLVLALLAKFGGNNLKGGAVSMLLMVAAIKLLVMVLEDIKDFDPSMIYDNIEGYGIVFGGLLALAVIARIAGKAMGLSMLGMIASVVLMGVALKMLEFLNIDAASGALVGFAGIILGMATILAAVSKIVEANGEGKKNNFVQLGAMMLEFSAAIIILIAAIALMGMLPLETVIQGGIVVAALMVLMAGLIAVTAIAKNLEKQMLYIAIVMGILVAAVAIFAFMGPEAEESIWNGVKAVAALMAMLALLVVVTRIAGDAWKGMAMLAGVVAVTAGIIYLLSTFGDVEAIIKVTEALSNLMYNMSVTCLIATIIGALAVPALKGLGVMAVLLVALGIIMGILSAINGKSGNVVNFIEKTLPIFEALGKALGSVFKGFVSAFDFDIEGTLQGISDALGSLSESLTNLGVNAETMDAVTNLIATITALTAVDFIDGIKRLFGGQDPLTKLGTALKTIGPQIADFAADTSNVVPSKVNGVAKVLEAMVDVAEKFTDSSNVERMGETLEKFGPQFKTFSDNISEIDPENVRAMAQCLSEFANSATELQNAAQSGTMDLGSLLQGQGFSLNEAFANGQWESMNLPLDANNEMFNLLGNQIDLNSIDISQLANSTGGEIPSSLYEGILGNTGSVTDGTDYIQQILQQGLPTETASATGYAYGYASGEGTAQGLDAAVGEASAAAERLSDAVNTPLNSDTQKFYTSGADMAGQYNLGTDSKQGEATASGERLSNASLTGIEGTLGSYLEKGTASAGQFIQSLLDKEPEANSEGVELSQQAVTGIESNIPAFTTAGSNAGQGFIDGLISMLSAAESAGAELGNSALNGAKSKNSLDEHSPSRAFHKVGDFGGIAFVAALLENTRNAYNAGKELGGSSLDGVQNAISVMSSYIEDNLDSNPMITPILDLSQVRSSSSMLAKMLNDSIDLTRVNASVAAVPVRRPSPYSLTTDLQNGVNPQTLSTEIYNTFYIQSHDPQGVANETSRIIQRQAVRRDVANGRTGL